MKFTLVPQWLWAGMDANGHSHSLLADTKSLSNILSQRELSIYFMINSNYEIMQALSGVDRKLISTLFGCGTNVALSDQTIRHKYYDKTHTLELEFRTQCGDDNYPHNILHLWCEGETHPARNDAPASLCLKPVLINTDVMGLIFVRGEHSASKGNLRRDHLDVMKQFMTTEEVISSPLFGLG
ncbi:hypothetical protein [Endozoicomonas sp. ONNA1]|uniref:hypothetical protein n=1 Tax=Endozoicomonas sp. ONNA1 TaxID=2828740 RepID=UPI0021488D6E|nr:hypothetical protein [Endozoicomonas sp. ONNA1]